jgi:hypothetical protein
MGFFDWLFAKLCVATRTSRMSPIVRHKALQLIGVSIIAVRGVLSRLCARQVSLVIISPSGSGLAFYGIGKVTVARRKTKVL